MQGRSILHTVLACAVILVSSKANSQLRAEGAPAASAPALRVVEPKRGEIIRFVTLPANVRANQQATLYAKVSGYLAQVKVDKGQSVKEGELLAEIEVPELLADLKKLQADAKVAALELERLTQAQKKAPDLVLPQALDKARGAADAAQAATERTETLLGFAKISAPFAGVITMRFVDPGAFVPAATAGSTPQNAALFTLMDFSTVRLQIAVPEVDAALVKEGQPVKSSVEGLPGKKFESEVTRFSYALDEATRTMLVESDVPNADRELRPGMYATVKLGVGKHTGALLVPTDALVMEKAAGFVFKLVEGKARKTPVTLGFNDGTNVEIAKGISEGEKVIVAGKTPLTEGQAVQPIAEK